MANIGTHSVPRSNDRPLRFEGELVAERDGKTVGLKQWHHVRLYHTQGGKWVVAVSYRSTWPRDMPDDMAMVCDDPVQVATVLNEYDPTQFAVGPPEGALNAAKRRQEHWDSVTARYDSLVAELLSERLEFAEIVE